jgi:hypothetical protein
MSTPQTGVRAAELSAPAARLTEGETPKGVRAV